MVPRCFVLFTTMATWRICTRAKVGVLLPSMPLKCPLTLSVPAFRCCPLEVRTAANKFDKETTQEETILRAITDRTVFKIKVHSYFGKEQESVAVHRAVALRIVSKNLVRMVEVRLVDKPCRGSRDYFFKLEVVLRAVEAADNENSEAESSESSSSDSEAESDGSSDDEATAIAGEVVRQVPRRIVGLKHGQILVALREAFFKPETKSITLGYIRERSTTCPARISNDTYRCTMLRCTSTADS